MRIFSAKATMWSLPSLMIIIAAVFAASTTGIGYAQVEVTDDDVNRVASQLFCPTCEAIPVDVCPTEVCNDWRAEIRAQLEAGRNDREILDDFALRYGSGVLANPPAEGFGLFVWIAPIVVLIGGVFVFVRYMGQLQSATPAAATANVAAPAIPKDDYRARLEQELRERE